MPLYASLKSLEKPPGMPWSDMVGMRNILIHDYIDVDTGIIWETVSTSLPELQKMLETLKWLM
jgi:uncharacterized protein with HEPN domain